MTFDSVNTTASNSVNTTASNSINTMAADGTSPDGIMVQVVPSFLFARLLQRYLG